MTSGFKRLIILCLVFVWCFLGGVCCLEAADHLKGTPDDQAIEQLLSVPVEKTITANHGQPITPLIVSIQNFSLDGFLIRPAFVTRLEICPNESPPKEIPKLYQLYSNYRI